MTEKANLINAIIDLYDNACYLEIGVDFGQTFRKVKAAKKVGVDPCLKVDESEIITESSTDFFYPLSSDQFFAQLDPNSFFDVIFIDGLHEFNQVVADLVNSVAHLSKQGIIIIDDTVPPNYQASIPSLDKMAAYREASRGDLNDWTWSGDVYKVDYFIDHYLTSFTRLKSSSCGGQTIAYRSAHEALASQRPTLTSVSQLDYSDFVIRSTQESAVSFHEVMSKLESAVKKK